MDCVNVLGSGHWNKVGVLCPRLGGGFANLAPTGYRASFISGLNIWTVFQFMAQLRPQFPQRNLNRPKFREIKTFN